MARTTSGVETGTQSSGIDFSLLLKGIAAVIVIAVVGMILVSSLSGNDAGKDQEKVPDKVNPESSGVPVAGGAAGAGGATGAETNDSEKTDNPTKETAEIKATSSANLKFLKKIGPFDLPPYGEKVGEFTLVTQSKSFSLDDDMFSAGITSTRSPGISCNDFPTKKMIFLLILRDDNGNCLQSKIDETTGNPYFMRMIIDQNPTTPFSRKDTVKISVEEKKKAQTWEVSVYSY